MAVHIVVLSNGRRVFTTAPDLPIAPHPDPPPIDLLTPRYILDRGEWQTRVRMMTTDERRDHGLTPPPPPDWFQVWQREWREVIKFRRWLDNRPESVAGVSSAEEDRRIRERVRKFAPAACPPGLRKAEVLKPVRDSEGKIVHVPYRRGYRFIIQKWALGCRVRWWVK